MSSLPEELAVAGEPFLPLILAGHQAKEEDNMPELRLF